MEVNTFLTPKNIISPQVNKGDLRSRQLPDSAGPVPRLCPLLNGTTRVLSPKISTLLFPLSRSHNV